MLRDTTLHCTPFHPLAVSSLSVKASHGVASWHRDTVPVSCGTPVEGGHISLTLFTPMRIRIRCPSGMWGAPDTAALVQVLPFDNTTAVTVADMTAQLPAALSPEP